MYYRFGFGGGVGGGKESERYVQLFTISARLTHRTYLQDSHLFKHKEILDLPTKLPETAYLLRGFS